MLTVSRGLRWPWVAAGAAVVVMGLFFAGMLAVGASFNRGDDVDEGEHKTRVLEAEIEQIPGVTAVDVGYQNDFVTPGVLAASVRAEPGSDLDGRAAEVVRMLWLSDIDVLKKLRVVVRWPADSDEDPPRETQTYASDCAMTSEPECQPLQTLEDTYGTRPD
jgi:hypothetical protein